MAAPAVGHRSNGRLIHVAARIRTGHCSHAGIRDHRGLVPVIGALVGTDTARDEIDRQLCRIGPIRFIATSELALHTASARGIDVLVTELVDEQGGSIAPLLRQLAVRAPTVPVLLYDRVTRTSADLLCAALAAGLRIDCVVRPFEPLATRVREELDAPMPPPVGALIVPRLIPAAPVALRSFIAIAALKAPTRRGLDQLARWCGVTPRAIERRIARAGWAPAHTLLQSVRALDALWLMAEHHWPARRVQRARGLAHASGITRLMRRYCGITPAEIREGVDLHIVVASVLRRLTNGRLP